MRLILTTVVLGVVLCVPFFLWGEDFTGWFSGASAVEWIRGWGSWGWLAVVGLLVADVVLPIPATPVMSAAGYLYGAVIGGLVSAMGSFLAGMVGYGLCRGVGRGMAVWLAGEKELGEQEQIFRRSGPWLVAASRCLPLLPEVISCLAGLTRMPLGVFALSMACGSLPMGFIFAGIGASGGDHPRLALLMSLLVPPVLWLVSRQILRRGRVKGD